MIRRVIREADGTALYFGSREPLTPDEVETIVAALREQAPEPDEGHAFERHTVLMSCGICGLREDDHEPVGPDMKGGEK